MARRNTGTNALACTIPSADSALPALRESLSAMHQPGDETPHLMDDTPRGEPTRSDFGDETAVVEPPMSHEMLTGLLILAVVTGTLFVLCLVLRSIVVSGAMTKPSIPADMTVAASRCIDAVRTWRMAA